METRFEAWTALRPKEETPQQHFRSPSPAHTLLPIQPHLCPSLRTAQRCCVSDASAGPLRRRHAHPSSPPAKHHHYNASRTSSKGKNPPPPPPRVAKVLTNHPSQTTIPPLPLPHPTKTPHTAPRLHKAPSPRHSKLRLPTLSAATIDPSARRNQRYIQPVTSGTEKAAWFLVEGQDAEWAEDVEEAAGEAEEYVESLVRKQ